MNDKNLVSDYEQHEDEAMDEGRHSKVDDVEEEVLKMPEMKVEETSPVQKCSQHISSIFQPIGIVSITARLNKIY